MNLLHWLRIAVALCGFATAGFAQLTGLEGDIRDATGKLLPNAEVRITRLDANRVYPVKSDKKGHYYYSSLPAGLYTITVQMDGRAVGGVNGILTQQGTPFTIDIYLGDTPEQQAERARQQIRQRRGEWSYIKPMLIQGAPAQSSAPDVAAGVSPGVSPAKPPIGSPAGPPETGQRADLLKQRQSLTDAFSAGVAALEEKRYADAIVLLKKAIGADPKQAIVWANLGSAYVKLSGTQSGPDSAATLQQGLDAYAKSIELKADDAVVHYNYAMALARAGRLPEMRTEIKRCADLDAPNAYHAYYNLGAALSNIGQADEAAGAFKQAIDASPEEPANAESYYQYGVMLMSKAQTGSDGKMTPAAGTVEALRKYLDLAPQGANASAAKELLAAMGSSPAGKPVKKK
jgi:tetratricopeptide (TPR) repeat protein